MSIWRSKMLPSQLQQIQTNPPRYSRTFFNGQSISPTTVGWFSGIKTDLQFTLFIQTKPFLQHYVHSFLPQCQNVVFLNFLFIPKCLWTKTHVNSILFYSVLTRVGTMSAEPRTHSNPLHHVCHLTIHSTPKIIIINKILYLFVTTSFRDSPDILPPGISFCHRSSSEKWLDFLKPG